MIDVSSLRAEKNCFASSCFGLSNQEIQFVLKFPGLNNTQKLLWMSLAILNANDPDFASQLSLHQFAHMLNMRPLKLWRAIEQLEAMGLVHLRHHHFPTKGVRQYSNILSQWFKFFKPNRIQFRGHRAKKNMPKCLTLRRNVYA